MKLDHPNLTAEPDRYGNMRYYVRVKVDGRPRRERIDGEPGTPEFLQAYTEARERLKGGGGTSRGGVLRKRAPAGSMGWLATKYFASPEFLRLDVKSQSNRRSVIESCLQEPLKPGSKVLIRDVPYREVNAQHIKLLRDRRMNEPGAANNRKKYMSAMFGWAVEEADIKLPHNPCRDVSKIKTVTDGYHTWTTDEVLKYIECHPKGTKAYLALCLMLFLGARKQDAVRLGPRNIREVIIEGVPHKVMAYVPKKTGYARVEESIKPILPVLAEAIRSTRQLGIDTFLVTDYGKPFSEAGFGGRMRDWCDEAKLPECTSHGLKKVAATIVAEMGATDRQMMALFDWKSEKMANVYTRKANKAKLSADAVKLLGSFFQSSAPIPIENKSGDSAGSHRAVRGLTDS